jgi:hypothetical protein
MRNAAIGYSCKLDSATPPCHPLPCPPPPPRWWWRRGGSAVPAACSKRSVPTSTVRCVRPVRPHSLSDKYPSIDGINLYAPEGRRRRRRRRRGGRGGREELELPAAAVARAVMLEGADISTETSRSLAKARKRRKRAPIDRCTCVYVCRSALCVNR